MRRRDFKSVTGKSHAAKQRQLFVKIASRYDLVNRFVSLGQDLSWRRLAARLAVTSEHDLALDVACGTGEMALALARRGCRVIAVDLCSDMLMIGKDKVARMEPQSRIDFLLGDVLALPVPSDTVDCVTMGFAMRDVEDISLCLAEMRRVLKTGGRLVNLDLTHANSSFVAPFHRIYLSKIVPVMGRLLGRDGPAYDYLGVESLRSFPTAGRLKTMMENVGLRHAGYRLLNRGTVAIHWGVK